MTASFEELNDNESITHKKEFFLKTFVAHIFIILLRVLTFSLYAFVCDIFEFRAQTHFSRID